MKTIFIVILFCCSVKAVTQSVSIYSIKVDSIAGSSKIDLEKYRGKKILIINTASKDSMFATQYKELMQLYQIYQDKLVIIAVPTNSFGTEPGNSEEIGARYIQSQDFSFPVTQAMTINGTQLHPLFKWLTQQADNGVADSEIKRPFYKYLIGTDGKLIALFNQRVSPLNPIIQTAINK